MCTAEGQSRGDVFDVPYTAYRRLDGGMDAAPVRHDPARKRPVALQHLVQQEVVLAGIDAIDPIVGAHHRPGTSVLDGDLEGQHVRFPHRLLVDVGAERRTAGLLVVQSEVLDGGDDVAALDAGDGLPGHHTGQQRILAVGEPQSPFALFRPVALQAPGG